MYSSDDETNRERRSPMRIHLDTDLGGDPEDACALAMLLGWPGVEVVGITTTIDPGGVRAGYAAHCLELAGREDIPLKAGAEVSLTTGQVAYPYPADDRYWPSTLIPRPSELSDALDLLQRSIAEGATVVGIGPSPISRCSSKSGPEHWMAHPSWSWADGPNPPLGGCLHGGRTRTSTCNGIPVRPEFLLRAMS